MTESTVVLGFEDAALQEEVLHFLDRLPRLHVVGAATDGKEFLRKMRDARPDAAVASPPMVADGAAEVDGTAVFVVAERETTQGLRTALRVGARGFYLWPEEREELARAAERSARPSESKERGASGRVVAVLGARGGAGATFLATSLAAACAGSGSTVLVDFDTFYGDVTTALGAGPESRTSADLTEVMEELTLEHLDRVLYAHPRGFRALLAPHDPSQLGALDTRGLARAAEVLRSGFETIVLHLPRSMDVALPGVEIADDVLIVVTLDVLAFRDAKRLLSYIGGLGLDRKCHLVVNRATRAEVVPDDVERVFGVRPRAVLRHDGSVARAQNRGEVLALRGGHLSRQITKLSASLMNGEQG